MESKAAGTIAAEVRAHFKGLSTSERMKLIQHAIDDGDHTVATALLGAPAMLSGIDANMQKTLTRMYHERHNPHTARRLKAMQGAKALIEDRAGRVFVEMDRAIGGTSTKANKVREAQTAAENALIFKDA